MSSLTVLDVALGLAFVYLLFSLLVSALNEVVLGHLTRLRSQVLEDSLKALLSNQGNDQRPVWVVLRNVGGIFQAIAGVFFKKETRPDTTADCFARDLLQHPLVTGLTAKGRCPSYLPTQTFVGAVLGLLLPADTTAPQASKSPDAQAPNSPATEADASSGNPPAARTPTVLGNLTIAGLGDKLSRLPDEHARKVLTGILAGAKDLEEVRQRLATWFDDAMARVKGLYKRYTQFWVYVWAALIVVALNVDTLELAKRLLADAQFREAIAAAATSAVEHANPKGTNAAPTYAQLEQEINQLKLPLGWHPVDPTNTWPLPRLLLGPFPKLGLPNSTAAVAPAEIFSGWTLSPPSTPTTAEEWWLKLLGLLITVAAVSQGAPFWFDTLNRVTNLRAVGRPPESPSPRRQADSQPTA